MNTAFFSPRVFKCLATSLDEFSCFCCHILLVILVSTTTLTAVEVHAEEVCNPWTEESLEVRENIRQGILQQVFLETETSQSMSNQVVTEAVFEKLDARIPPGRQCYVERKFLTALKAFSLRSDCAYVHSALKELSTRSGAHSDALLLDALCQYRANPKLALNKVEEALWFRRFSFFQTEDVRSIFFKVAPLAFVSEEKTGDSQVQAIEKMFTRLSRRFPKERSTWQLTQAAILREQGDTLGSIRELAKITDTSQFEVAYAELMAKNALELGTHRESSKFMSDGVAALDAVPNLTEIYPEGVILKARLLQRLGRDSQLEKLVSELSEEALPQGVRASLSAIEQDHSANKAAKGKLLENSNE